MSTVPNLPSGVTVRRKYRHRFEMQPPQEIQYAIAELLQEEGIVAGVFADRCLLRWVIEARTITTGRHFKLTAKDSSSIVHVRDAASEEWFFKPSLFCVDLSDPDSIEKLADYMRYA